MVVRLYGTCQGADVVFQRDEAGTWSCAVPASPTGAYAIQPDARGDYLLSYQFGLGTEIIRRSVPIKVI